MPKIYRSMIEVEREYYPVTHQIELAKRGKIEQLLSYVQEKGIELNEKVIDELIDIGHIADAKHIYNSSKTVFYQIYQISLP